MSRREARVAIVYPHLPLYRRDVFLELDRLGRYEYMFAADLGSRDGSIVCMDQRELRRFHRLRNRWVGPLLWQSGLLRMCLTARPDAIVYLGDAAYLTSWLTALVNRILGVKVIHWTIGWHKPDKGARRVVRLMFYRLADRILLYGNVGRELGVLMGYPEDRMGVVLNSSSQAGSVPPAEVLSALWDRLPPGGRPVIGAVIRLQPAKKLESLIHAAAFLKARYGIEADVLLIGDGPERERLARLAQDLGVGLYLPGALYSEEELAAVYSRLSLTVLPTLAGLSVIQSLRFGVPVITHDNAYEQVPEYEAIIPGSNGDLFPHGDMQSMTEVIAKWVSLDPEAREQARLACLDSVAEGWNPRAHAQAIERELVKVFVNRLH